MLTTNKRYKIKNKKPRYTRLKRRVQKKIMNIAQTQKKTRREKIEELEDDGLVTKNNKRI